ncbi:MAG: PTS sugar transporter subunit IIB [Atopobium sp.]|uniref:PTS sugar transporter subunit IIB n=1 Tax=Atopobium sp. TaxID=1872650 RepID=UPI002A7534DC|nr:PTS sugar transporter subunit IIB [Atopobium sp.]MDY2787942.1 PTS sugar transporter subunit IIB [Atopobium sp.]MDY4523365.1 PTS sugar transporter subunit IIB [Atopobium sp.]
MKVSKIMCACGSGLGSSLLVEMNIQDVLKKMGIEGISVSHSTTSDVKPGAADLFVVGRDLADFIKDVPAEQIVVLQNIIDKNELEEKLREKNIEA